MISGRIGDLVVSVEKINSLGIYRVYVEKFENDCYVAWFYDFYLHESVSGAIEYSLERAKHDVPDAQIPLSSRIDMTPYTNAVSLHPPRILAKKMDIKKLVKVVKKYLER